jgi:hypothetical protein
MDSLTVVAEILAEMVLDEANPYRDAEGHFSRKDAGGLYAAGAMAAGRAAGIKAKQAGKTPSDRRSDIILAIRDQMIQHRKLAHKAQTGNDYDLGRFLSMRQNARDTLQAARGTA